MQEVWKKGRFDPFFLPSLCHSPLQLIVRRRVLGSDIGQFSEDLCAVDGKAGQQDELLPGGAEQAGVVLYGELAEEGQLLNPGDLAEEQLVCKAAQQGKQLNLRHFVPATHSNKQGCVRTDTEPEECQIPNKLNDASHLKKKKIGHDF